MVSRAGADQEEADTPAQPQSEREAELSIRDPSQAMGAARQDCGGVELPWSGATGHRLTAPVIL